ncbi:MAG: hypothetical protein AAGF86_17120, partial [Pseudomonadota bacterium]
CAASKRRAGLWPNAPAEALPTVKTLMAQAEMAEPVMAVVTGEVMAAGEQVEQGAEAATFELDAVCLALNGS